MTETETAAGALSAGIDLTVPAPVMSDIKATAGELLQHIEDVHLSTEASTWLDNARAALASAVQYIESHFAAFEEKLKSEFSTAEAEVKTEVAAAEAKVGDTASSIAAAAAGAAITF